MSRPLLLALALLVAGSSALRLLAPAGRLGRPVAQARDEDAASTTGQGFGPPRQSADAETLSRGQKALEELRAQAGAPPVPKKEPEMYIPTRQEKAPPAARRPAALRPPPSALRPPSAGHRRSAALRSDRRAAMPCQLPCRASLAHLSRRVPACAQDTIVYGFAGFLILGGALPLALPLPLALALARALT